MLLNQRYALKKIPTKDTNTNNLVSSQHGAWFCLPCLPGFFMPGALCIKLQVNESLQKGKHNSYSLGSQFLFISVLVHLD